MIMINPSPNLLAKYNSGIEQWSNKVIGLAKECKSDGIPQWVKKWPRAHNIIGPLLTWMPMIMFAGTLAGAILSVKGVWVGPIVAVAGLMGAIFSLPFIETNEQQWCDVKYDWETWTSEVRGYTDTLKKSGLQYEIIEQSVAQILELQTERLNFYQKSKVDDLIIDLQKIVDNYKKENDTYILNTIEAHKNMTVNVDTPSILDNFGRGTTTTSQSHDERSV